MMETIIIISTGSFTGPYAELNIIIILVWTALNVYVCLRLIEMIRLDVTWSRTDSMLL